MKVGLKQIILVYDCNFLKTTSDRTSFKILIKNKDFPYFAN